MASMRVHELAKEFGMTSKELLERLEKMKIPAKNHASTLVGAYVDKIRKELGPELAERAAAVEAAAAKIAQDAQEAEEAARAAEEAARKAAEEEERARRDAERVAAEHKAAEEARIAAEASAQRAAIEREEERAKQEAAALEQEESKKAEKPSRSVRYNSLFSQIEAEKARIAQEEKEKEQKRAARAAEEQARAKSKENARAQSNEHSSEKSGAQVKGQQGKASQSAPRPKANANAGGTGKGKEQRAAAPQQTAEKTKQPKLTVTLETPTIVPTSSQGETGRKSRKDDFRDDGRTQKREAGAKASHKRGAAPMNDMGLRGAGFSGDEEEGEDRYRKMAADAERFQRDKVLAEARAAVVAAKEQAEGEGRRKKRKEKRVAEAAAKEEAALEEAIMRGEVPIESGAIKVPTGSTVAEFAELLGIPSNDIIKRLFLLGTPLTLTQTISDDLIELIADDMGRTVRVAAPEDEEALVFYDAPDALKSRPPVVTVMGHVDHGKTSLLDAIRSSGVAETEAGGITQHIGASVVWINDRQITFIDTPGHEAFTAMRARGAKITDIVVLVVAADDGVMPQTIEAIHHAEAAGVPIVVAVNKIDKPGADPSRARQELTAHGIVPEEWGGNNMFVDVSAKKKLNIDDLLETIILQADVLELKANPDAQASGFVIEANLDKGRGPVATVLIHRGTLKVGDAIVVGTSHGRVRAMLDPKGNTITQALPSDPVEVLGLSSVPDAGDEFQVFADERDARDLAEERALRRRLAAQKKTRISLEDLFARIEEGETTELNLVVKADVQGSIEALADALEKMDQSEVRLNIIHSAVGGITETDVTLAAASNAIIIGFGVRPQPKAKAAALKEQVDIRTYRVIYKAIEDINAARVGLLSPDIVETDTGSAEVRSLFRVPKAGTIAGCYVTEGEISRDDKIRIVRDGTVVHEGSISSLRRFKDDVKTVKNGYECGIGIDNFQDVKEGDIIEGYVVKEVAREG